MTKQEIGNFIQSRRSALSMNQEDLAELTGITTKTIYLVENGRGNPSLATLEKILDVLGLELSVHIKKTVE